jgi:NTE family protein
MTSGLVLSGGGGKGAYQIGALRALSAAGFSPQYVAGTSIGALNGALLVQGDLARAERCWQEIGHEQVIQVDVKKILRSLTFLLLTLLPTPKGRLRGAKATLQAMEIVFSLLMARSFHAVLIREGLLRTDRVTNLFDQYLDYDTLCRTPTHLSVCVYQNDPLLTFRRGCTAYHRVASLDAWTLRRLLLASTAIPVLFPAIVVGGKLLHDGGVGDNTPIRAVAAHRPDQIVVIYLKAGARTNTSLYPGMRIFDIAPSRSLGPFPVSTINFDPQRITALLELGYQDAQQALAKS